MRLESDGMAFSEEIKVEALRQPGVRFGEISILYSTHYMEEVERLADRVILIDRGRVVAEGTSAQLITRAGAEPRIEVMTLKPLPPEWAHGVAGVRELARGGDDGTRVSLALPHVDQAPEIDRKSVV